MTIPKTINPELAAGHSNPPDSPLRATPMAIVCETKGLDFPDRLDLERLTLLHAIRPRVSETLQEARLVPGSTS